MVTINRVPVNTPVSSEGSAARCRPFCKTEIENSPSSVPQSVPRPPNTEVPPNTTAVMASMASVEAMMGEPTPSRAVMITAARPAISPLITSTITRVRGMATPAIRAASRLPPIA